MLDVGDLDDAGFWFPIEERTVVEERVVDHVDHDARLDLVLGTREQLGGQSVVGGGITRARGRSREWMAGDLVAADVDEEFRGLSYYHVIILPLVLVTIEDILIKISSLSHLEPL